MYGSVLSKIMDSSKEEDDDGWMWYIERVASLINRSV